MSKRAHEDVPAFPDATGWTPKAGATRGKVVKPTNKYCGEYYWSISVDNRLSYFEYEKPSVRAEAAAEYLAKKSSRPVPSPSPSPSYPSPSPSYGASPVQNDDALLRGMERDVISLKRDVVDLRSDMAALRADVRAASEVIDAIRTVVDNLWGLLNVKKSDEDDDE